MRSFRQKYDTLVTVVIFRDRILKNLEVLQQNSNGLAIAPVLKSNAYGHGLVEVANILDGQNLPFFVADSYHEARNLRASGIRTPILVIGFTQFENLVRNRDKTISFTITDFEQLKKFSEALRSPQIFHLKIDTGMSRQGVLPGELDSAIALIKKNPNIVLEGVCSHLADSAHENHEFNDRQIALWNLSAEKILQEFRNLKYYHLPASAGLKDLSKIKSNMGRIGKAIYGLSDVYRGFERSNTGTLARVSGRGGTSTLVGEGLQPAMEMRARLTGVKKIKAGDTVSYGMTFKADRDMVVGTIPVGYFEGVDRRLSNVGVVQYKDKYCRILGRVSMNITVIDLTEVSEPKAGDEVVVVSANREDQNSVENLAKLCGTIALDFVVHIPQHLRRVVR